MSLTWAWRAAVNVERAKKELLAAMAQRGFVTAKGNRAKTHAYVYPDGRGGTFVISWGVGGPAIAATMSRALAVAGFYAEVDLADASVTATSRSITAEGHVGDDVDRTKEAGELCEQWFVGKKYKSEAAYDLAAIFVEMDECPPAGKIELAFDRMPGMGRVQSLIDAVVGGASWQRIEMSGKPAVRLVDVSGSTRISVLDDGEMATFERDVAGHTKKK